MGLPPSFPPRAARTTPAARLLQRSSAPYRNDAKKSMISYHNGNDQPMPNGDPTVSGFPAVTLPNLQFGRRVACKVLIKNDFSEWGEAGNFFPEFPGAAG